MPRFVHFELPARDPQSLARFYTEVFGWEVSKWDGPVDYWMIRSGPDTTPGINGGFYTPDAGLSGTINTMEIDDIDGYLAKVTANGGTIALPKHALPGVGWLAYCRDTEGTLFGLMQMDLQLGQGG